MLRAYEVLFSPSDQIGTIPQIIKMHKLRVQREDTALLIGDTPYWNMVNPVQQRPKIWTSHFTNAKHGVVNWWYTTLKHGLILFNNDQRFERLISLMHFDLYRCDLGLHIII